MSTFLFRFLENTQRCACSQMENYCSRSHKHSHTPGRWEGWRDQLFCQAAGPCCQALHRPQTHCTLTTHLPAWLPRCPLQLGPAHPGASLDAQLCPWLLRPTLPTGVSSSTECSGVWLFSFSWRSNLSVIHSCTAPDARGDSVKAAKPHRALCSGAWLSFLLLKLDTSAGVQLGFSIYFWLFLTYN